jgi:hypothetical protein
MDGGQPLVPGRHAVSLLSFKIVEEFLYSACGKIIYAKLLWPDGIPVIHKFNEHDKCVPV